VILVDDLEHERRENAHDVFRRYRDALDRMLQLAQRSRASVHFFVNMLEAYYFADASALNGILGTDLEDHTGDVEEIRNPKAKLKALRGGFDEVEDGGRIVQRLDLPHVLSNPETCAWLRALFGWCTQAVGQLATDEYQLRDGVYGDVTRPQINGL